MQTITNPASFGTNFYGTTIIENLLKHPKTKSDFNRTNMESKRRVLGSCRICRFSFNRTSMESKQE